MNSSQKIKEAAKEFLLLAASGQVREAYRKHVSPDFRHHNAYFKGDAESLMAGMEENATKNPNKMLEIQRTLQEGDLVAIHSHVKLKPNDLGVSLVHIFKFQEDKIVELWDIGQAVPEYSPNEFGMF